MNGRFLTGTALGLLACCTTTLAAPPVGQPIDLSLKFKVGEVSRYRLAVEVDATVPGLGPQPSSSVYNVNLEVIEQEKVMRLLPHGGGELGITTLSGHGLSNGTQFTPSTNNRPALVGFSSRGDLVSIKDLPTGNAGMPLLGNMFGSGALSMSGVFLPDHPVRIGDSWNKQVRISGLTGNMQATVHATFTRMGEVGHYKVAKIHATLTAPLHTLLDHAGLPTMQPTAAASELTGTFTMTYDTDLAFTEGKLIRTGGNGTMTVLIQPRDNADISKPKSHTVGGTSPQPNSAAPPTKMVLKLHMGNVLMQEQ